jgi:dTDP-4-amino-4,6-dideoxygalactose transaminase
MPHARHVYHIYAVRSQERDALQSYLQTRGIQTGIHYPIPVHLQKAYADLGYRKRDFPHSEKAAAEVLSLPMYPELSTTAIEQVAAAIRSFSATSLAA